MTVMVPAAVALCCWIITGTKLYAFFADRSRSAVLRDYTVCMAALAGVFTLLVPPVIVAVDRISANLALLLNSLLGIVCLTAGQTILVANRPSAVRRWWTSCLIIDVTRVILFAVAPERIHRVEMVDFAVNYTRYPTLAAFNALRLIWFTIIFTNIWRSFREYAHQETSWPTRCGLWVHSGVGALGIIYVGYEVAYVCARRSGNPLPGMERQIGSAILSGIVLMLILATAILYVGPAVATRFAYRGVRPLWEAVAAHRAGGVLDHGHFSAEQRLIRRRQENVDGLARLVGYYDSHLWQQAYQLALASRRDSSRALEIADAATILGALETEASAGQYRPGASWAALSAPSQDELGWQIAVGKALRSRIATALASTDRSSDRHSMLPRR